MGGVGRLVEPDDLPFNKVNEILLFSFKLPNYKTPIPILHLQQLIAFNKHLVLIVLT